MGTIEEVALEGKEKTLADAICWNLDELSKREYGARMQVFEAMGELTELLLARKAIPTHRVEYLTDPNMFVGGYGKSRQSVFEKNGVTGTNIFRSSDFMKYLRYFIHGPDLPKPTIDGFCKIIEEDRGTSGEVLDQITAFVRKEVREKGLSKHTAAEEFFKLAYEIDKANLAEAVRSAALQTR